MVSKEWVLLDFLVPLNYRWMYTGKVLFNLKNINENPIIKTVEFISLNWPMFYIIKYLPINLLTHLNSESTYAVIKYVVSTVNYQYVHKYIELISH